MRYEVAARKTKPSLSYIVECCGVAGHVGTFGAFGPVLGIYFKRHINKLEHFQRRLIMSS